MIYRKTRLGFTNEIGGREILAQMKEDGSPVHSTSGSSEQQQVEKDIIEAALYGLRRPGHGEFTDKNGEKLEAIDKILSRVDMVLNKEDGLAIINEKETGKISTIQLKGDAFVRLQLWVDDMLEKTDAKFREGGFEYHILKTGYDSSISDGKLTKEEIERLKKIDAVLENVDMSIDAITGDATIIHPDGALKIPFSKPQVEGGGIICK